MNSTPTSGSTLPALHLDGPTSSNRELSQLRAIADTQSAIYNAGLNLELVMTIISERMQAITGATGAVVELAQGDEMVYMAGSGTAKHSIGVRLKQSNSLSGYCVRTGQIVCCGDSELDDRVDREACRRVGARSMVIVPLMHETEIAGVLKVLSPEPYAFGEESIRSLQLMAGLGGNVLGKAREYDAKQKLLEERTLALEKLRESEERFRNSFISAVIGKALVDLEGQFLQVNQSLCNLLGYYESELLRLRVQDVTHKDDLPAVAAQVNQVISGRRNSYQIEKRYLNKTGQEVWVLISASVVHDRDGRPNYFITEVQDIGDRKRLMAEMERLAHHDPLTGVPNRRAFDQRLRDEILTSRRHKRQFSLGLFDIDKFKTFNDTYGHPAGDEILREIGHILSQTLRPNDFAGRYGGEEFVFILPETSESEAVSAAERLRKVIAGHNWQIAPVTASFGLATWTGEDAQTLLAGADLALYGAKRAGRNRVVHRNSMPAEPES